MVGNIKYRPKCFGNTTSYTHEGYFLAEINQTWYVCNILIQLIQRFHRLISKIFSGEFSELSTTVPTLHKYLLKVRPS